MLTFSCVLVCKNYKSASGGVNILRKELTPVKKETKMKMTGLLPLKGVSVDLKGLSKSNTIISCF